LNAALALALVGESQGCVKRPLIYKNGMADIRDSRDCSTGCATAIVVFGQLLRRLARPRAVIDQLARYPNVYDTSGVRRVDYPGGLFALTILPIDFET
jgi:hypothetical protein